MCRCPAEELQHAGGHELAFSLPPDQARVSWMDGAGAAGRGLLSRGVREGDAVLEACEALGYVVCWR